MFAYDTLCTHRHCRRTRRGSRSSVKLEQEKVYVWALGEEQLGILLVLLMSNKTRDVKSSRNVLCHGRTVHVRSIKHTDYDEFVPW